LSSYQSWYVSKTLAGTNKKVIVKINDVGPLKPGRIIDFAEQTMRYFDPTLQLGLIHNVNVTPLIGDDWMPGPVAER
jgi:rare lipoprotein A